MRLRTAQNKLKIEHSIIDGVRKMLERLLEQNPEIRSVIPGVIRLVRAHVTRADAERLESDRAQRRAQAGTVHHQEYEQR